MANVTDEDILLRVEALLALVSDITTVITDDDCPLTDELLPAAIVIVGEGVSQAPTSDLWYEGTTVEIGVMFTRLCTGTLEEQRAQMLTALRLRDAVPDYFTPLDRLTLNGRPMNGIDQPTPMRKSRLEIRPWGVDEYYSTAYTFTVPSERR